LSPDQRFDAYFIFYALLEDKQCVDIAACDLLYTTQQVVWNNIPQSLTDEIDADHMPRPQGTSLFRQKMTEVRISWHRREVSAQQQINQEKKAVALISSANSATCPLTAHRTIGALVHYPSPDHRTLRRLNVHIQPLQKSTNLAVLHQRLLAKFP
jgi:hypothetical protein